jgi:Bacterial protein of unknown function (DUF885)
MTRRRTLVASLVALVVVGVLAYGFLARSPVSLAQKGSRYEDLVALFEDWRRFQQPKVVNAVPDYTPGAMEAQHKELPAYQRRLAAIEPARWPIPQQSDYHLVRAEMNGLDFDHRVRRPWVNNPAFYVTFFASESDQPAREGQWAYGSIEFWMYSLPLDAKAAAELDEGLRAIPGLLEQAKKNLVGTGRDLWIHGIERVKQQSTELERAASQLKDGSAELKASFDRAKAATNDFVAWLDSHAASKTGPSGVGVENYDWHLQHVQLAPYSWAEQVVMLERELARAHSLLALEEQRNAGLPQQSIVTAEEYDKRFNEAVTEYMAFLRDRHILTVRDYMDPALRARIGTFSPGAREFFTEINYRDPMVMRTHGYHWFDKGWMVHESHPSPMRKVPLLYNIFITRTEGHATGWEEMMLAAGMFDARPRSRELIYILLAQRAARGLGDLRMHSNEATLEQASQFASDNTPRGWLPMTGRTVRSEQHLYLQQPSYGTSYLIGKIQIEQLLAARRRQLGDNFTMNGFMDELNAAGLIPMSLIEWELTGEQSPRLRRMLAIGAGGERRPTE